MASNNMIKTELTGSSFRLKIQQWAMSENIFYVEFRQKECTNIIKVMFFK